MLDQIKRLHSQKNYGLAFEKCQTLLHGDCSDEELYYLTGVVLKGMDDIDLAENYFMLCLQFRPGHSLSLTEMAQIYFQKGRYDECKQICRKLTNEDPNNYKSRFYLGRLSQKSQSFEQAITYYEKCLAIKPRFMKCRKALNRLEKRMKKIIQTSSLSAEQLKKKVAQLEEVISNKESEEACIICLSNRSSYANIVCGHCCVCETCLPSLNRKCPLCKAVSSYIRIYRG